jgi:adenylylsulfate kinase
MEKQSTKSEYVTWFEGNVNRSSRAKLNRHKGAVIWFTGLSASGKSTIAHKVEHILHDMTCVTYVLDGDNVRHGLCGDLGFDEGDRKENIRRIGETVKLFVDAGLIVIAAFISPYRKDRQRVKDMVGSDHFMEIFVDCPVALCAERDWKGIYDKAMTGQIKNFTGISSPYESPGSPDLVIRSDKVDVESAAKQVIQLVNDRNILFL